MDSRMKVCVGFFGGMVDCGGRSWRMMSVVVAVGGEDLAGCIVVVNVVVVVDIVVVVDVVVVVANVAKDFFVQNEVVLNVVCVEFVVERHCSEDFRCGTQSSNCCL